VPQSNQTPLRLTFDFEWRLTLATALLLPLLVSLGFWQLSRAEEKRELSERHALRSELPATGVEALLALSEAERSDRRLRVEVEFAEDDYLLLDNRLRNGRYGFEVVALARSTDGVVPLNLGWVPGDPARRSLPEVTLPKAPMEITGRVYIPASEAYVLAEEALPQQLPAVVQGLPMQRWGEALEVALDQAVFPHEVRIASDHPAAFLTEWAVVNQSPAKHTAYAVQWFTMAAVLLVAFLMYSTNLWALIRRR
jgi:cytochrome oxidase assembly protein ShyY1